ncbi:MAG: EF-hand domain-containing protein, partial [Myxococcaceae bacterium]
SGFPGGVLMASKKKAKRPAKAAKKSTRRAAAKRSSKRPAAKSRAKTRTKPRGNVRAKAPKKSAKRAAPKKRASAQKNSGLSPSITVIPEYRPENLTAKHAPVDDFTSSGDEMVDIFQRYDRDRTGEIDREEFSRLLEAMGQNPDDETLQIALDVVDTDRTGKITFGAFKRWWLSR